MGARVFVWPFPPWALKIVWNRFHLLPAEFLIGKVDWYHSSDFLRPPLLPGTRGLTTIHDLTWKIYPQYHTPEIISGHTRKLQRTLASRDLVLVDSRSTYTDLLRYYPEISPDRVHILPLGVSDRFKPASKPDIEAVRKKYQLPVKSPYLLYVGAIEPRKRLDIAITAFARLISDPHYANYQFVIAGRAGWKNAGLFTQVKDLKLTGKVIFPGYIEDPDLPALLSGAKLFVYLSDYEGFGLPPLEALSCGTPVIAANSSSLTEILPREMLVDTADPAVVVSKMKSVITNPPVFHPDFSWDKYATAFISLISDCMAAKTKVKLPKEPVSFN